MQPRQALAQSGEERGERRLRAAPKSKGFWCQRRQKCGGNRRGAAPPTFPTSPPLQEWSLTSALIGALRVHAELVGSTVGSLCATLVNIYRKAGKMGNFSQFTNREAETRTVAEWSCQALIWWGSNGRLSTNTGEVQLDSRLPRQRVHFPICLATQYGLVVEFWPTGCKQK